MHPYRQPSLDEESARSAPSVPEPNARQVKPPSRNQEVFKFIQRSLGGGMIVGVTIATILLWLLLRPAGQPMRGYLGEMLGTTAVLLFTCSLVVATKAFFLEPFFGGLDRMYIWHRWTAVVGIALLLPHFLLARSIPANSFIGPKLGILAMLALGGLAAWALIPRLPLVGRTIRRYIPANYRFWFTLHRFTGLFVIAGLVHGFLVDPVLQHSAILLVWYIAVAEVGAVAYLYREVLNPLFRRRWRYGYTVTAVNRLNQQTFEVILTPVEQPVSFVAGQFVFVRFGGDVGREQHPFTISSAPQEPHLRLSIKVLGDHTRHLLQTLQPGTFASVGMAFGVFDYQSGRCKQQIWIAGGIGITPFRSWIRAFPTKQPLDFTIDFYYTVRNTDEALFLDEIAAAAAQYPNFRPHITYWEREGYLTIEHITASCPGPISEKDIYMCGASRMTRNLQRALRKLGVSSQQIHFEHFEFR